MSTSSAGGGGGPVVAPDGSDLAKEATVERTADATEALAKAVDGTTVRVVDASPPPTFAAAVPAATEAPAVRIVGDGLDRFNEPILRVKAEDGQIIVAVQGDGSGDPQDTAPWLMQTVRDEGGGVMAAHTIATEETLEAVRDRLPQDGGRLAVETELAASSGLAVEAKQDATIAAIDELEADADATRIATQANAVSLASIDGKQGDRRTSDPLTARGGQVVRLARTVCDPAQTTPGTPTFFLQARNTPGRLKSFAITNLTAGQSYYVLVLDAASYAVPPAVQPAISTRKHLDFVSGLIANTPGQLMVSFDDEEMVSFANGVLILLSTASGAVTAATAATAVIEAFTKAVPS